MASCVKNIPAKIYQNLLIVFQVTVKNVEDGFWDTVYNTNEQFVSQIEYTRHAADAKTQH